MPQLQIITTLILTIAHHQNVEQNKNMTKLSSISENHFAFECQCNHVALVPVKLFLDRYGPDALLKDMVKKARCSRCGSKNILRTQIIYVGNSAIASLGSAVRPHPEP